MSEPTINQAIADKLCVLLEKHKKSQEDLAAYMGVTQATVSNWCNGIKLPRIDRLDNICMFFGVNRSDLIPDAPNLNPSHTIDGETQGVVDFLYENPEYTILLESFRHVKKRDIELVRQLLNRMNDSNRND